MQDGDWKYHYLVDQLHRTAYKKHECYVIGSLIHDPEFVDLQACTQYYVKFDGNGYALVDLYYPQIDLAVEIDEPHHESNQLEDSIRQDDVERYIKCNFFRVSVLKGDINGQISKLKDKIRTLMEEYRNTGKLREWKKPARLNIKEAKAKFQNTLFIKIKGKIHPKELMARQTGYWRIAKNKHLRISQVIVIHNGIVSRLFREIKWHIWKENPNKVGYMGSEVVDSNLIGAIIEN